MDELTRFMNEGDERPGKPAPYPPLRDSLEVIKDQAAAAERTRIRQMAIHHAGNDPGERKSFEAGYYAALRDFAALLEDKSEAALSDQQLEAAAEHVRRYGSPVVREDR